MYPVVGVYLLQSHPAVSGGAGIGTPARQAPEPQVGHSGGATGPEVSPAPAAPEPGDSRGWEGPGLARG